MWSRLTKGKDSSGLRRFGLYFGSSIINKAVPFLLIPLLTAALTPAEYGAMALFQSLIALATPLLGMNLAANILRSYYVVDRATLTRIIGAVLAISVIVFAVGFAGSGILVLFNPFDSIPSFWLLSIPWIVLANSLSDAWLIILRSEGKAGAYSRIEIIRTVIDLGLTVVLVLGFNQGWEARAISIMVAATLTALFCIRSLHRSNLVSLKLTRADFEPILRISIPLLPYGISMGIISMSGRVVLEQTQGADQLGLFAVGAQFGMAMQLLVVALDRALSPWFYRMFAETSAQAKARLVRAVYAYILLVPAAAVLIGWVFRGLYPYLVAPEYAAGRDVIIWVSLGYGFYGINRTLSEFSIFSGRTDRLAAATTVTAVMGIGITLLLVNIYGYLGAAMSLFATYFLLAISTSLVTVRSMKLPWLAPESKRTNRQNT